MLTKETYKLVEGYRRSDSIDEIQNLFNYWSKKGTEITAWQKSKENERVIVKFFVDQLNPLEPDIRLYPIDENEDLSKLKMEMSLYLHTPFNKVVTGSTIVYLGRTHLFIALPDEMHIWDQQKIPRIKINHEGPQVTFNKQKMTFKCPIIDISNSGMAFKVGKTPAKYFSFEEDEIVIKEIFQQKLPDSLKGNVVYLKELSKDRGEYRVGIKFQSEIDLASSIPNIL